MISFVIGCFIGALIAFVAAGLLAAGSDRREPPGDDGCRVDSDPDGENTR